MPLPVFPNARGTNAMFPKGEYECSAKECFGRGGWTTRSVEYPNHACSACLEAFMANSSSVGNAVEKAEDEEPQQGQEEEDERTIRERAAKVVGLLLKEETTEEEGKEAIKQYIDRKGRGEGVERVRVMVEHGDLYLDVIEGRIQNPFAMEMNLRMRMRRLCSSVWSENPTPRWKKEKYEADVERLRTVSEEVVSKRM